MDIPAQDTVEVELDIDDKIFTLNVKRTDTDVHQIALDFCATNSLPTDDDMVSAIADSLQGALDEHSQGEEKA